MMTSVMVLCKNNNKNTILFFGIILVLLTVWHLATLTLTPIPWVDEVYFASVTNSLVNGDGFTLGVGINQEVYHYGPVYFLLTGLFTLIGGLNPFTFRLTGLIFSYLAAYVIYKILRNRGVNNHLTLLVLFVLFFDQLFVYCAHIGRMDIVSAFFVLFAFYYYDRFTKEKKTWQTVVIALMLLLAVLTTLRCAITIVPLAILILIRLIKGKDWKNLLLLITIPVVGYLAWVFLSYGSLQAFVDYFVSPNETAHDENFLARFLGGSFIISKTHYPLVLLTLCVVAHSIIHKYYKEIQIYLYTIILFYVVVHSTSDTYSVMILPFYYLIAGIGVQKALENQTKGWFKTLCGMAALCAIVNVGVFFAKWGAIESSRDSRNDRLVSEWISSNIPSGAKVVGSDAYYYVCMENGCDYKSLEQVWTNEEGTKKYMFEEYHPTYILINKVEETREALDCFHLFEVEKISHYTPTSADNWIGRLMKKIGFSNKSTYEGDLYKVIY